MNKKEHLPAFLFLLTVSVIGLLVGVYISKFTGVIIIMIGLATVIIVEPFDKKYKKEVVKND